MVSILAFVHIVLSIFLVILVLIQDPKGGGAGGLFGGGGGGGSNSLFGATGAPSFLAKITRWVAVIFAGSCIAMTIFIKPESTSVLDSIDDNPAAAATQKAGEMEKAPTEDLAPTATDVEAGGEPDSEPNE